MHRSPARCFPRARGPPARAFCDHTKHPLHPRAAHDAGGRRLGRLPGPRRQPALHIGQREPQRTNLVVSFKEAGLGTNELIDYAANATATATYVCVNGGNTNPSAGNKTTITTPVTKTGTFSSGKNGNVNASLTINAPGPGSFSCPPGQKLELASVTYSGVSINDTTNGITDSIPGTFTTGCLLPGVKGACT